MKAGICIYCNSKTWRSAEYPDIHWCPKCQIYLEEDELKKEKPKCGSK